MSRISILGGGSWGTGLAVVFSSSRRQHDIRLWVRDSSLAESLEQERENKKYLPGVSIPACVKASTKLEEVLHEAQVVVGAVPSPTRVASLRWPFRMSREMRPSSAPQKGWNRRRTCV